MKRGNEKSQWWTCTLCQSRWERIKPADTSGTEPTGEEPLTWGRHSGRTMEYVRIADPNYCHWVLMTSETEETVCSGLMRFARYLTTKEQQAATAASSTQQPTPPAPTHSMPDGDTDMTGSEASTTA